MSHEPKTFERKDYQGAIAPKWCPGCGNHGIFKSLTKVYAQLQIPPEKIAVISGIGCSSRLPYYLHTYGFHTLHGRAPTVALGVKVAHPELSVWIISGDGDALAIGGNHFIHFFRHNPDVKLVLFNNQVYGLTKGQASPTSVLQQKTATTPAGVQERPLQAASLALAAGASFVARTIDTHLDHVEAMLLAAARHKGAALVEVLTNCVIFNDGAFTDVEDPVRAADHVVSLRDGEPMVYGKEGELVLKWSDKGELITSNRNADASESWCYDSRSISPTMAYALSQADGRNGPLPIGVLWQREIPTYPVLQTETGSKAEQTMALESILAGSQSWKVSAR